MSNESGYLETDRHQWHYLKMGEGTRLLLMFHGYGNSASIFTPFSRYLSADFTMYSFDLPHHGNSNWEGQPLVTKADLGQLAATLMDTHKVNKVSLCGYSMGGRICLSLVEVLAPVVDKVLLIAPDGLRFNPLYFFVTKTYTGRKLFSHFLSKPDWYVRLLEGMRHKGWIDTARLRFIQYYIGSAKDRQFLGNVWRDTSMLIPSQRHLRKIIKEAGIPVFIFMGRYDTVIPLKHGERFVKGLPSVRLFIMEKGHRVFDSDTLPQMSSCLISGSC